MLNYLDCQVFLLVVLARHLAVNKGLNDETIKVLAERILQSIKLKSCFVYIVFVSNYTSTESWLLHLRSCTDFT